MRCAISAEMPATAFRSSMPARDTALAEPKCFSRRPLARRADAVDLVERIGADRLRALGAVRADGEAMRLVAQALDEIEHGIARLEHEAALAAGNVEMLAAGVAVGPLGDADQRDIVNAEFGQHLARDARAGRGRRRSARDRAGREIRLCRSASVQRPPRRLRPRRSRRCRLSVRVGGVSARRTPKAMASAPRSPRGGGEGGIEP